MIAGVWAENCFAFAHKVEFSLEADMRSRKLASNVQTNGRFHILKSAGIYGPNNSGKTCLVRCILAIKQILLHEPVMISANFFTNDSVCKLGVSFVIDGRKFRYEVSYDARNVAYPYEKFSEVHEDQYGNEKEEVWILKDVAHQTYTSEDGRLSEMMPVMSQNNILIYLIDSARFPKLAEMKQVLVSFARSIDIVDMNTIPVQKTVQLMKNENDLQKKVVDFIKHADVYMDDFKYVPLERLDIPKGTDLSKVPANLVDQLSLVSVYKSHAVPSMLFDSMGTRKIAALASYIIEALEEGRVLVVDELDSSIHFKLTRAIVAMFNNELNTNAQIIFTVHDINLMDCKRLLRKEQIWFVHKDEGGVYLYSLAEFTARDGVRDTSDVMEKYRRGALGALPDPDLIQSLLEMHKPENDNKGEKA